MYGKDSVNLLLIYQTNRLQRNKKGWIFNDGISIVGGIAQVLYWVLY